MEGNATIYGWWLDDRISVFRQTDEPPEPVVRPHLVDPPCEAPPGGRPHPTGGQSPDAVLFDPGEREGAEAIMVSIFRPDPDRAVLVVAATDIAVVEAQLRPQLDDRLCVVASRPTRQQLDETRKYLWARDQRWPRSPPPTTTAASCAPGRCSAAVACATSLTPARGPLGAARSPPPRRWRVSVLSRRRPGRPRPVRWPHRCRCVPSGLVGLRRAEQRRVDGLGGVPVRHRDHQAADRGST